MSVGQPVSRLDGRAKVTGAARYTADIPIEDALYAVLVPSAIVRGATTAIDTSVAERSAGVVRVFTHLDAPKFGEVANPPAGQTVLPLQGERIAYEGQPIALVVADTLEQATAAAKLVRATYREEAFVTDFLLRLDAGEPRPSFGVPPDASVGDISAAEANAEVIVEAVYVTADRHHNAMEPSATVATWHDDELIMHDFVQGVVAEKAPCSGSADRSRPRPRDQPVCRRRLWVQRLGVAAPDPRGDGGA